MAVVFLARDLKHDRQVAIKVLRPELRSALGAGRFVREISIAAQLHHPHILPLYDSGEADGFIYYVMPYVDGESLRDRLRRETQLPLDDAVQITREVADALSYAHSRDVVHRDIKPENILLESGHALVADFGIARAVSAAVGDRVTETGVAVGTAQYMSPEQASGEQRLDARSDIYSLGCVLYEMLVGEPPFTGPNVQSILARRLKDPVPPIRTVRDIVPEALETVARRALARAPADRFASAAELIDALPRAGSTPAPAQGRPPRRATLPYVAAGLVLLAAALGLFARLGPGAKRGSPGGRAQSIAVLPFVSLSSDPNDQYFSDGMSEELITALGKVPRLKVVPRTSAFAFKGRTVTSREIGRELGVEALLEGTVRRAGNRVRVTARLISAGSDSVLWADEYERDVRAVFAVQDEIARAITGALEVRLAGGGQTPLVARATESPEAYDLYLRGRYFFGQRTGEGLRKAVELFQQAIQQDSTFAAAYSGLSDAYSVQSVFGYVVPRDGLARAQAAAQRALALDSSMAEAQASLGIVRLWRDWDLPGAERELTKAIALDSGYATAHLFLAWDYIAAGQPEHALREVQLAQQEDPLSVIVNTRVGSMFYYAHDYGRAVAQLRRTLELDSTNAIAHAELARVYVAQHRCGDALAQLRFVPPTLPNYEGSVLGYAYAACGQRQEALRVLHDLEDRGTREFVMAAKLAIIAAALGERDTALARLEQAAAQREWPILVLGVEPLFETLRSDPRFTRLARRSP